MARIHKELKLPSCNESLSRVEIFVDEICEAYYITNSYYGNILMAVLEAVKNAIQHGNKNNPDKQVKLSFKSVPNGLCFTIKDQGNGFNFRVVPNPIELDNGQAENAGKGIFLMRSLADQVSYNSRGNVVEIVFFISTINQETTLNRISQMRRYFNKQKSPGVIPNK
jgi:serine/threonine-protein kinase RsbW